MVSRLLFCIFVNHQGPTSPNPDDRLVVKFYGKLLDVLYASKNLSMLKVNLLDNKEALSITEDAIMDYFAFYGSERFLCEL